MTPIVGIDPEELRVCEGQYLPSEDPLEAAWSFWYDKKTSDRKESDQYMEGLKQLGSFNTIQGFYRHYTYLLRPSELPRDQNLLLFRKGYKPMWEEFPEGGCWIIRIKRKVSQSYVNRMWENLLLACIGEEFEMPDVVGCVLSTRLKDDVLSIWNISNRDTPARFRIGEKLKEILDLDMNALIQYKDHMQSLQDYSTYRNAKNYMFAPSPTVTPMQSTLETPLVTMQDPIDFGAMPDDDFDEMLPPAAVDTGGFDAEPGRSGTAAEPCSSAAQVRASPRMSAAASPWSPELQASRSPAMSAAAAPWSPAMSPSSPSFPTLGQSSKSAGLSADAEVFKPKESTAAEIAAPAPTSSAPATEPTTATEPTAAAAAAAAAAAPAEEEEGEHTDAQVSPAAAAAAAAAAPAEEEEGEHTDAQVSPDAASLPLDAAALDAAATALAKADSLAGGCSDPAFVAPTGAIDASSPVKASAGKEEESTGDMVDTAMFPSLGNEKTQRRTGPGGASPKSWASVVAKKSAGNISAGASGTPVARKGAGPKARAMPDPGART
eukprot:CAMPEP_0172791108 /NCGR_PEP_ID=MMETSP1074-20121228/208304_1 /TAXON_ID=2916 /ORGANISM="Ceratium fusus, Strain PA161109" /LENGTH=548 /DNA_ID=CAMNT_0013628163 /DNA_START=115 /DNA_END=1761 /DNA_ORIENTATION=+